MHGFGARFALHLVRGKVSEKFGIGKKFRYWFRKFGIGKKVLVSVSENLVSEKKSRYQFRSKFWYRHSVPRRHSHHQYYQNNYYHVFNHPEGEPGDKDNHGGGHVDGQDEEGELPGEQVLVRSY